MNDIKRLPDAEQEVMQALWECEAPATRADIEKRLFATHPMAQTTLLTLLTRLSERDFITIDKVGRKRYYRPLVSREDYLVSRSKSFFEKLCGGNVSAFANALCSGGLSKDELDQLRELLERGSL